MVIYIRKREKTADIKDECIQLYLPIADRADYAAAKGDVNVLPGKD
jgi:hypothetical protein